MSWSYAAIVMGIWIVAICAAEARGQVAALTVLPERTLLGLPAAVRITISNTGSRVLQLDPTLRLEVVDPRGETFIARSGPALDESDETVPDRERTALLILPGRQSLISLPLSVVGSPGWFFDRRLAVAGRFLLRVILTDVGGGSKRDLASQQAALEIVNPTGIDALAWSAMKEMSSGKAWTLLEWTQLGVEASAKLWSSYPESTYACYAAVFNPGDFDEGIRIATLALRRADNAALKDTLRLTLAGAHRSRMFLAVDRGEELDHVLAERQRTEEVLKELGDSSDPWMRELARSKLDELPTAEEVRESVRGRAPR